MPQHICSKGPPVPGFEEAMEFNAHSLQALAQTYGSLFQRVGAVNGEMLNFCVERWKEDIEIPAKVLQCKAPEELSEAYTEFYSKMFTDYNEQANKVLDLVCGMPAADAARRKSDDPKKSAEA